MRQAVRFSGLPVSAGTATGRLHIADVGMAADAAPDEVRAAFAAVAADRSALAERLRAAGRAEEAAIIDVGALIAADPALSDPAVAAVRDGGDAATAIAQAAEAQAAVLQALPMPELAERAGDVRQIAHAVLDHLSSAGAAPHPAGDFILIRREVSPADLIEFAEAGLVGAVSVAGGASSHAAIIARGLGVPMVTGVDAAVLAAPAGQQAILIPPFLDVTPIQGRTRRPGSSGVPAGPGPGKTGPGESGPGESTPGETGPGESSPGESAGLAALLAHRTALPDQLRVVLETGRRTRLSILIPMVSSLHEVSAVRDVLARTAAALGTDMPKLGIMVELEATAAEPDTFAAAIDFFSIGTNDLTGQVLGLGRRDPAAKPALAAHPRVLALISGVADAGRRAGIGVSVCGDSAADPLVLPLLVGLGVNTLSVPAAHLPRVLSLLADLDYRTCAALAAEALRASTVEEVWKLVQAL